MKDKTRNFISSALLICSFIFVGVGYMRGEALDVLRKATAVCLECIGIG